MDSCRLKCRGATPGRGLKAVAWVGLAWGLLHAPLRGEDAPQFGQAWTRNSVSSERNLPATFNPQTGLNLKWTAKLGTETHASPVIGSGRVLIGSNNGDPRDPKHQGDRGVLMCLDEATGQLQWQLVVPKRTEDIYFDWPRSGICSTATVEGDRVYVVDNRGVVLCLDLHGLANGNDGPFRHEGNYLAIQPTNAIGRVLPPGFDSAGRIVEGAPTANRLELGPLDADILWLFDLTSGAGIWSHDAAHSSILIRGPHLYLNTGTGVDNTHRRIRAPDAPSLVVLDKATGQFLGREREGIAPNIFHSTWAPPALAAVHGRDLLFFAAGNGIVYAFEPLATNAPLASVQTLKQVFQFDFDPDGPKTDVHRFHLNKREGPSNFYGAPVFHDNRLYVAGGGDLWWGKNQAWLKCLDATGTGDVTVSGLRWSRPLGRHTFSSVAVAQGLAYVSDCSQTLHCVDADTGTPVWTHDLQGEVWASPFVADGKVYLGTRRGFFYVFAAGRDKQLLAELALGQPLSSTVTAANGVLYVATMSHLYAVAQTTAP
ncbi:MAG: pyrrolo-quinoline quinone [Verrucomicrobia bacterium]|nr:pyrrolo-quinoline quinone [Verrucomicrobiota bacterium]